MVKFLRNRLVFYGQAFKEARQTGAFSHTSRAVADAVAAPIVRRGKPLKVLEVGAGTGAITEAIVERMGAGDELHLIEINPEFVKVLQDEFGRLTAPKIRIDALDIEKLPADARYDVICSSLPLFNFTPEKVRACYDVMLSRLAPGGTLSYYDYWGKELRAFFTGGREGKRLDEILDVTREIARKHEYEKKVIPWNVMPARVHYLRRDPL